VSYFDSIYADTLLPPRAVSVYMYLKDRSNSAGSCWPGIKTIARDMNLSRSTVKRALADLEQHGYLAKLPRYRPNGSNTSNLYTLKPLYSNKEKYCISPPREDNVHLLNRGGVQYEPTGTAHSIGD
jgi:GntR family transcriptional regulator